MEQSLEEFYNKYKGKIQITEGNCGNLKEQQDELIRLCKQINPKSILEIGFNAGHSSELFLKYSNAYIVSFDIGDHFDEYLKYGKAFLNQKYPSRHTLVFGDSTKTIPRFSNNHKEAKFDLIFIDGGHDYEVANADIINCSYLAHKDTIVVVDDIVKNNSWDRGYTVGPKRAWQEAISNGLVTEMESFDWAPGRGMCIGKYNV